MKKFTNYYYVLGVSQLASRKEIRTAYEQKKRLYAEGDAQQALLEEAFSILHQPLSRERYDEEFERNTNRRMSRQRELQLSLLRQRA
ncbi:DnaJ domain-containing protein [Indiicoccus explosivorum]|uniref:DnaJ domain-containing protein n=1 Tax=Indiicoccus explosivorum TaxID=1917864 RepID=UPI000B4451A0|nr:DnaJ domain-containing protein [Indiicoccus explosivorum]